VNENRRFWSTTLLVYLLVFLAFIITGWLILSKGIDGEALGLVVGVWLREGLGVVFNILNKAAGVDKDNQP
jgi:hypothetical protein